MKNEKFAERMKILMHDKGIKASDLAELVPCSKVAVSVWRAGKLPSPINRLRLAKVLGVSQSFLFEDGRDEAIFSNCGESNLGWMRSEIEEHISELLDEAEEYPGALEHLFFEIKLKFPKNFYKNAMSQLA